MALLLTAVTLEENIVSSPYRRSPSRSFGSRGNTIVKTPVAMRSSSRLRTVTIRNLSNHRVHAFKDQLKKEEKKERVISLSLIVLTLNEVLFPRPRPLSVPLVIRQFILPGSAEERVMFSVLAQLCFGGGGGVAGERETRLLLGSSFAKRSGSVTTTHSTSFEIVFDF